MKHRWRLIFLKVALIATLLLGFGGIITSQTAHASSCDSQGTFSVCAIAGGSVTVQKPTVSCSLGGTGDGYLDIMQGCNGSNWEKIGYSNFDGVQEWVLRYGWTYSGTGDGYRYFAFSNYAYFIPDNLSQWWITYSDGNEYNNNCYSGGHSCDYNAWDNYITDWHSPTAQVRDWVTTGRPNNQAFSPLEYPSVGLPNCKGSEKGSTGNVSFNLGYSVAGGTVGVSASSTYQYSLDGECNDGATDAYSTYMNLNWGGVTCTPTGTCGVAATQSALSFLNVTATNGPSGNPFYQGWNLSVNWWETNYGVVNFNLPKNGGGGPNANYQQDKWTY